MNAKHLLLPLLLSGYFSAHSQHYAPQPANPQHLCFIENKGQITDQSGHSRSDVQFRVGGKGMNLFVGSGQLHYQWAATSQTDKSTVSLYRMDVALIGADPQAVVTTEQKQGFYEQYYMPQFGEQGTIAHSFQKITYKDVYPHIDWVLYVNNSKVEYDFIVKPGGKVSDIRLQYGGATGLSTDKAGRLTATTPMGSVTENTPASFQQADGKKVASAFTVNDNTIGFTTGSYTGTLVIDPTLSWATYHGGTMDDYTSGGSLAGDISGNVYLTGYTNSTANIATTGAYQTTMAGGTDAFLTKFNKNGVLLWSTYYGGTLTDNGTGVICDQAGNVFMGGYTNSTTGIATTGSYQAALAGSTDAFVVKFDSTGARQWGTYFGGTSAEQGLGINADRSGNIYLTGYTSSTSGIATTGAYQTVRGGGQDAFIVKFTNSGSRVWSTYFGGSTTDNGFALSCDTGRNVFLCGYTRSTAAIASTGAFQTTYGGSDDGFVVKFDSTGVKLWSTYFGGTGDDRALSMSNDKSGNLYLSGYTFSSSGIATTGSHQSAIGGNEDGFMAKFSSTGSRIWATYYGGTAIDAIGQVTCDSSYNLFLVGVAGSTSGIATTGTYKDTLSGYYDAFIAKFDTSGVRTWSTYFGGDADDQGNCIVTTPLSEIYISGTTPSLNGLATTGSHQAVYGGGLSDVFLAKLNACVMTQPTAINGNDTVCRGAGYTYTVPAVTGATSYTWIVPTGWTGSSTTNSITLVTGKTSDTIRVAANFLCGTSTVTIKRVYVNPLPVISPSGTVKICNGDSASFTATTGTAYRWQQAGTNIAGATNASYTAHTAGLYTVAVTATNGCVDTSLTDTLIVRTLPIPVIAVSGAILSTGTYATYQWSRNGTAITGAINPTYTMVILSGNYTVSVTDTNGCSGISAPYTPSVSVQTLNGKGNVKIYPNPVQDWLYITTDEPVNVTISSIDGRLVSSYNEAKRINVSSFASGVYILRISSRAGNVIATEKLIRSDNR